MRNFAQAVFLVSSLVSASAAVASDTKIGIVDMEKAVMQTTKAKAMSEQFVKEFKPQEEKIKKIDTDMKALNDKLTKGGSNMAKAERDTAIKQMQSKNQERNDIVKKIKQAEQDRLKQLHAAVDPKIKDVMKAVADKGEYTMIIDKKSVPYYNSADEVTQQVTELLNQAIK